MGLVPVGTVNHAEIIYPTPHTSSTKAHPPDGAADAHRCRRYNAQILVWLMMTQPLSHESTQFSFIDLEKSRLMVNLRDTLTQVLELLFDFSQLKWRLEF